MITILKYGMGNVGSLYNMIKRMGGDVKISDNLSEIESSDKLVLPGVGAFDNAMKKLSDLKMIDMLNYKVIDKKTPILCICLGMQLITKKSEEGELPGLGWVDAETQKFQFENNDIKIPHMGWNTVNIKKKNLLINELQDNARFYFVHSYFVKCNNKEDILLSTNYGIEFTSAIIKDNIYATQFHPEKSHKFGMKIINNFIEV